MKLEILSNNQNNCSELTNTHIQLDLTQNDVSALTRLNEISDNNADAVDIHTLNTISDDSNNIDENVNISLLEINLRKATKSPINPFRKLINLVQNNFAILFLFFLCGLPVGSN